MSVSDFMKSPEHKNSMKNFRKVMERRVTGYYEFSCKQSKKQSDLSEEEEKKDEPPLLRIAKKEPIKINPM
jgi:hypothetical protein